MTSTAHLRVVTIDEHGEAREGCQECVVQRDIVGELNKKYNAALAQIARLKRDDEQRAKAHPFWDDVHYLFTVWRRQCRHPRSSFTPDAFWTAISFFEQHGPELCLRAIAGRAYDPGQRRRKNGTWKRYDDWTQDIFRNRGTFEESCNRAPKGWTPPQKPLDERREG